MPELNPYAKFIDTTLPLIDSLAATPATLALLFESIGPDRTDTSPAPGKWSPTEILCHLADCEIAFAFRLRQTLAEDHHILQPFDQDLWAATYPGISAIDALATFTALRHWNVLLIRNSLPHSAQKPVSHPERGTMTFSTIVETMAGHDKNHVLQLQKLA